MRVDACRVCGVSQSEHRCALGKSDGRGCHRFTAVDAYDVHQQVLAERIATALETIARELGAVRRDQ